MRYLLCLFLLPALLQAQQPTIKFIGVPSRPIAGAVSIYADQTMDGRSNLIAVELPWQGKLWQRAELPGTATDSQIREYLTWEDVRSSSFPSYAAAIQVARGASQPLVTFVGVPPRAVQGCTIATSDGLDGYPAKCVIVSSPMASRHDWLATFGTDAKDSVIRAACGLEAPAARPFPSSDAGPDDRLDPAVRRLTFLQDLEPYTSAKFTQQSFRRMTGYIGIVHRSSLERKWTVPGGLADVRGWSSRLYKNRRAVAVPYLARQDPSDDVSTITWQRSYPDGAVFADVLRNDASEIFEIRAAAKSDGEWQRFVAFANPAARPHGYRRLTSRQCAECHDSKPGSAEYGGPAIPGGDTIISAPLEPVENGRMVQGGFGTRHN